MRAFTAAQHQRSPPLNTTGRLQQHTASSSNVRRPQQQNVAAACRAVRVSSSSHQLDTDQQQQEQHHNHQQASSSRRQLLQMLAAVGSAALVPALAPRPAAAAAAAGPAVSSAAALEEYMKLEDANKLKEQRALDNIRSKYGIKRTLDGRVQLRRKSNGGWVSVRLDMEVPGAILLRDTKSGAVYALETDGLPQVDLSDDYVLFMMFADGQWEADMTSIEFEEEAGGRTTQLTMTEKEFHEFVGLLKEPDEEPPRKK